MSAEGNRLQVLVEAELVSITRELVSDSQETPKTLSPQRWHYWAGEWSHHGRVVVVIFHPLWDL